MNGSVRAFIAVTGMGFGILLIYASVKNLKVLGPDGILRQFASTGKVDTALAKGFSANVPSASSPLGMPPGAVSSGGSVVGQSLGTVV